MSLCLNPKSVVCLLVSVCLLLSSTASANAKSEIFFLKVNFPPLWIIDGQYRGRGFSDRAESYIEHHVDGFSYSTVPVTVARATNLMKTKSDHTYCAVPHGKGFLDGALESDVWTAINGHVLVSRSRVIEELVSKKDFINANGQLMLSDFLMAKKNNLQGYLVKGQRYPGIDEVISRTAGESKSLREFAATNTLSIYRMVLAKRVDYTFMYESAVSYLKLKGKGVDYLSVGESSGGLVDIVVGCNNTPSARRFIEAVNSQMEGLREAGKRPLKLFHRDASFRRLTTYIDKL